MHSSALAAVNHPHTLVLIGRDLRSVVAEAGGRWPTAAIVAVDLGALAQVPSDLWRTFDRPDARDIKGLAVIVDPETPPSDRELTTEAIAIVKRAVAGARMNARAREENAGRYIANTLRNVPLISAGPDPARLDNAFAGLPAIVVGAGPSLDRQMADLRRFQDRAVIIAADTAWRPLASCGIDPHFVVAIDPTPANGRHLRDVPSQSETWLLVEGSVDPDALAAVDQPIAAFRIGSHEPWPQLIADGHDRKFVRAWGSVLTSTFDLAIGFGCDPIVFAGADLSFTEGRPYCRLTTFEDEWSEHTGRGASLETVWRNTIAAREQITCAAVNGEHSVSAPHLIEFRDWILKRAAEVQPRRVVNTTSAGILHGPAIHQDELPSTFDACQPVGEQIRRIVSASLNDTSAPRLSSPRSREVKCASFNLSAAGLSAGWSITRVGDRARFVPRGATESIDIAADGSLRIGSRWPIAIDRELSLPGGGTLAWNRETSAVMIRTAADAAPSIAFAPFRPSQAIALGDELYWYAFGGGIWRWHPQRGGARIIETLEATGFHLDAGEVRLAPLSRNDHGQVISTRHSFWWRVDLMTHRLDAVASSDNGQSVASDRYASWTARARPAAGLVELTHDDGRILTLPCRAPVGLGWAGQSLVVVTADGEVRLFSGLHPILG